MPTFGSQYFFVIAQRPGGPYANLVTVAPICTLEGAPIDPAEFRNYGLVFWRITGRELFPIEPGTLIVGAVEPSTVADAEHEYRLQPESVRLPAQDELLEILSLSSPVFTHPRDVLLEQSISVERPVAPVVLVRGSEAVFGFFRTEHQPLQDSIELSFSALGKELMSAGAKIGHSAPRERGSAAE